MLDRTYHKIVRLGEVIQRERENTKKATCNNLTSEWWKISEEETINFQIIKYTEYKVESVKYIPIASHSSENEKCQG